MQSPRSDWLFGILRGLTLLVLGWAFGALYGLSSLGLHSLFLPIGSMLLGFSLPRANVAGWILLCSACVGALAVLVQQIPFHPFILVIWSLYIAAGLAGNALLSRPRRSVLQPYLLLLLIAVGAGMVWQAYPTLAEGVFRRVGESFRLPSSSVWWTISLGSLLAGLLGGLTGLGGAYVLIPALVLMGVAPHLALWVSIWLMLPLALVSTLVGVRRATPSWFQEGWLSAGAFLGGVAGASWAISFSAGMLVICFGTALMAVSAITWKVVALVAKATSTEDDSGRAGKR